METIRKREGLVCVCAECKNVYSFVGTVPAGSQPRITHGICPACAERLYGEIFRAGARADAEAAEAPGAPRPPSSARAG